MTVNAQAEIGVGVDFGDAEADLAGMHASISAFADQNGKLNQSVQQVVTTVENLRKKQMDLAQALAQSGTATERDRAVTAALRQELERTTSSLNSLTGVQQRAVPTTRTLNEAWKAAASAAAAAHAQNVNFAGGLQRVDRALGPATEKGLRALSFGLGQAGGAAAELTGKLGDLTGLLAGGLAGIGIGAAVLGATKLYEAWQTHNEHLNTAKDAIEAIVPALNRMTTEALEPGRAAVEALRKELDELGTTLPQRSREAQSALIDQLEQRQRNVAEERARLYHLGPSGRTPDDEVILKNLVERAKSLDDALKKARKDYDDMVQADLALTKAKFERDQATKADVAAKPRGEGLDVAGMLADADQAAADFEADEADKAARAARLKREKEDKLYFDHVLAQKEQTARAMIEIDTEQDAWHRRMHELELARNEEKNAREVALAERRTQAAIAGAEAVGAAVGAAFTGQDDAIAQLGIALAAAAGDAIVLEGGKLVALGVATGAAGNVAVGGAQVAIGLGLVAAGAAVRTGGAAVVESSLGGFTGGLGGGGGDSGPLGFFTKGHFIGGGTQERARNERGFSRGGSGGGGRHSGGPVTIVFETNYGVAGPTAEDQARELARRQRLIESRRF